MTKTFPKSFTNTAKEGGYEERERERVTVETLEFAESIIATVREPLVVLDAAFRIVSASRSFYQTFHVNQDETYGQLIYELGNRQWDIPRLRELLEAILPQNTVFNDFEVDHDFPAIGRRVMLLNARKIYRETNRTEMILLAIEDITERKRVEEALRKAHDELEKRVQERTSDLSEAVERLRVENIQRKELEETLRESENRVRFFASQCLTAQETERKRVAGELHDSIAASLGAMRFRIDKIAEEMKQGNGSPESLQDLGSKVTEINNEVRRIMADLRPSILDDLGIIAAMNWFCREYQKTYSHISVENQIGVSEPEVPDSLKTPIFRIFQEAMNNIAKHSQADRVSLYLREVEGSIELTIKDNGKGVDLDTVRKGLGLSTMRERAKLSGGSYDLESVIGGGTTIRASWPLK